MGERGYYPSTGSGGTEISQPRPLNWRFGCGAAMGRAMNNLLLVMAGGAGGAGARYLVGQATFARFGSAFPWGTLAVNLVGGLLMGFLAGLLARSGNEPARLLLGVGVLGGFTTFSAFSLETWQMVESGAFGSALGYALASVIGSVLMLGAGLWIARGIAA
jgi:fluoride exporter